MRFLTTDHIEGGTPNNYTYPTDPVNQHDLTGMCGGNGCNRVRPGKSKKSQSLIQMVKMTIKATWQFISNNTKAGKTITGKKGGYSSKDFARWFGVISKIAGAVSLAAGLIAAAVTAPAWVPTVAVIAGGIALVASVGQLIFGAAGHDRCEALDGAVGVVTGGLRPIKNFAKDELGTIVKVGDEAINQAGRAGARGAAC